LVGAGVDDLRFTDGCDHALRDARIECGILAAGLQVFLQAEVFAFFLIVDFREKVEYVIDLCGLGYRSHRGTPRIDVGTQLISSELCTNIVNSGLTLVTARINVGLSGRSASTRLSSPVGARVGMSKNSVRALPAGSSQAAIERQGKVTGLVIMSR